jgi:hypothetical protein
VRCVHTCMCELSCSANSIPSHIYVCIIPPPKRVVTTVAVVSMSRLTQCVRGVLVCHQSSGGMWRRHPVRPVRRPRYLRGALLLPPVRSACGLSAVARAGLPARSAVASRHALDDAVGISPTRHTRHTHSDEPAPCIMSWARLTARTRTHNISCVWPRGLQRLQVPRRQLAGVARRGVRGQEPVHGPRRERRLRRAMLRHHQAFGGSHRVRRPEQPPAPNQAPILAQSRSLICLPSPHKEDCADRSGA